MYPTLYHAFYDLFGAEFPALKLVNSFGFFVALAFVVAARLLAVEMRRKEREGWFRGPEVLIEPGRLARPGEIAVQALIGFVMGWKFLYLIFNASVLFQDGRLPQEHLFSGEGSLLWGVVLAAAFAGYRWWEGKQSVVRGPGHPERVRLPASDFVGGIVTASAIGGLAGAKLFHLLEYPEEFVRFFREPSLANFLGGLTVYGGLILGALAVAWFARRKGLPFLPLADAAAPSMMLAYGIGRIGCQVSGDGDWGIPNPHPKPDFLAWAPDWMWAYAYPNNVNGVWGPREAGYTGREILPTDPWPSFPGYGTYLDPAVFPTPLYETLMATALFAVLWLLRKRLAVPGMLFGAYLIANGVERFLIEQIRVNPPVTGSGLNLTQAEIISVLTALGGIVLIAVLRKRPRPVPPHPPVRG
jgi:prolipoprotein diacylglyceryltransferase